MTYDSSHHESNEVLIVDETLPVHLGIFEHGVHLLALLAHHLDKQPPQFGSLHPSCVLLVKLLERSSQLVVRVLLLELLPAQLLILEHVLDELLNALANRTDTLIPSLRVLPDGLELGEDLIVGLLANLALRRVLSDALLDRRAHLLDEPDGRLDRVILKAARVQQVLEDRFGSVRS